MTEAPSEEDNKDLVSGLNSKRVDYLEWEDYFMAVAFLSAQRSKDPATQVGACIVNTDKKIVGIGYNGMPTGCNDDELPWSKNGNTFADKKYAYGGFLFLLPVSTVRGLIGMFTLVKDKISKWLLLSLLARCCLL